MSKLEALAKKDFNEKKHKFIKEIEDSVFYRLYTELLSKRNIYYYKRNIPESLIIHFYNLDKLLKRGKHSKSKGILLIVLMPDFDGQKGYIMWVDPKSSLTHKIFEGQKRTIGRALCSYDITEGKITRTIEDSEGLIKSIFSENSGPTILDKKYPGQTMDQERWYQDLMKGDSISVVRNEQDDLTYKLVVESSAEKSSLGFYSMVKEMSRLNPNHTMEDLMFEDSLLHLYNTHIKNSKRNNGRLSWESQRFLKVRIDGVVDPYSFKADNPLFGTPKVGVSRTTQYSNTVHYHKSFTPLNYYKYLIRVKNGEKIGLYSETSTMNAISYCCGSYYFPGFRIENQRESHEGNAWKMLMQMNKYGQYGFFDIVSTINSERFLGFPKSFVDHDETQGLVMEKKKQEKKQEDITVAKYGPAESKIQIEDFDTKKMEFEKNKTKEIEEKKKIERENMEAKAIIPFVYHLSKIGNEVKVSEKMKISREHSEKLFKGGKENNVNLPAYISSGKSGIGVKIFNSFVRICVKE